MAKFKVGDKVEVKGIGKTVVKTVEEIKSVVGPRTKYGVDIGGGKIMMVPEKDITASNAVRSTNSVVANALAANAAIQHNDIESQYITQAIDVITKNLRQAYTDLESHWQTKGTKFCETAVKQGFAPSKERIEKAHDRIIRALSAATNLFSERARNA